MKESAPNDRLKDLETQIDRLEKENFELRKERDELARRVEAQKAECASEVHLHRAVNIDTVGVLFFSLDGRLHDANPAFERMSGYTRRALADMENWMALTVPEFVGVTERTAKNLAERGTTAPYEKQMIRKDGSRWWGLFAPTRLSGSGRESQCVEFIIDITRQKQAEEALRKSEQRYRSLFHKNHAVMLLIDPSTGVIVDANAAACAFYGYRPEELVTLKISDINTLSEERIRKEMKRARSLQDGHFNFQHRLADGRIRDVEVFAGPIEVEGRELIYSIIHDVTARRQAQEALRESEDRYRSLFESIDEGFCIIEMLFDENGRPMDYRFLEVNKVFEAKTGITDPIERRMREIAPTHEEHWYEIYGRVAQTGESVRFQNAAEALGRYFDVYAFRIDRPEERHVAVLFNDITDRKRTEEKIVRLNAELTRANQELEAFNYSVAHDLRTPLTAIRGYLELTDQGCEINEECHNFVQRAHEGTVKMQQLIEGLLEFSQVSRGELNRQEIDLADMAKEIIQELQVAAPKRRVTVRIANDGIADGDPRLMQVVLTNLLSNAWKYTQMRAEAQIEFGVKKEGAEKVFFVRDNGAGFEMSEAEKLFTPFQRLSSAAEFRGHGIGLATVDRIIDLHGGQIWAKGDPGKGATFYFTLPYHGG